MQLISFLVIVFFIDNVLTSSSSSSSATVSYNHHCSSIVPQSIPTRTSKNHIIPDLSTPYIAGGHRLLNCNQTDCRAAKFLTLSISPDYYETNDTAIYKIDSVLEIGFSSMDHESSHPKTPPSIKFRMNGFWSGISWKLCMVGSASWEVESGRVVILNAVLKLSYASEGNNTVYTNVDSGILESTASANDAAYFDPISMFNFPITPNYRYSPVPEEAGFDALANEPLSLSKYKLCSAFGPGSPTVMNLQYAMQCMREPQHCSPLGGSLPPVLALNPIECSVDERKFRFTAEFGHMSEDILYVSLGSVYVGEAWWDDEKKHLYGVVCPLLDPRTHFGTAVGGCSVRLRMWYPSIQTIQFDAEIAGQLWSIKPLSNSGYFRNISLASRNREIFSEQRRYKYTEMDRVRESCPLKKAVKKKGDTYPYPYPHSSNMRFEAPIRSSKGNSSWGYASPISVGDQTVDAFSAEAPDVGVSVLENSHSNISYRIMLIHTESNSEEMMTAEGVYDAETGHLCMVGCRKLVVNSTYFAMDCDILVKLEFSNTSGGIIIKGAIESTRAKQDPLYFEDLVVQPSATAPAAAYFPVQSSATVPAVAYLPVVLFSVLASRLCFCFTQRAY